MVGFAADPEREAVAASRHARAVEVGRAFAEIIRDNPVVHELWVTADTEEPGIYLWLYTDPLDMEAERELFGLPMDRLLERFPREYMLILPVHARNTIGDLHGVLRSRDAEQIPLRAD
jgi:hypothetical protein